jgi:thiamine-phosphate pyrophosphorylase
MVPIYALIDKESLKRYSLTLRDVINYLNSNSIAIVQYRNKSPKDKRELIKDITIIKELFDGDIIVNDYINLVKFVDGLHIGQEDLGRIAPRPEDALEVVREKIGNKILGLSTHNIKEIEIANSLNINYIGLGAYRETKTKRDAQKSGRVILEYAKSSVHPVAIIGGVRLSDTFPSQIAMRVIGSDILRAIKKLNRITST